jgi:hypothetical protein
MKNRNGKIFQILAFAGLVAAAARAQGPVVLMGIDAEDGGPNAHGPITVYEAVVSDLLSNSGSPGAGILVVGGGKHAADHVTTFWNQIGSDLGVGVTFVHGAGGIAALPALSNFKLLAVASSVLETGSGGLTDAENNALTGKAAAIAAFVNNTHGGLLGLTQAHLGNPYGYLGGIGAFTFAFPPQFSDITPTPAGLGIGITDALDVCCWHDGYVTYPAFLAVLAVNPATGEASAVGGSQVVIADSFEYAVKLVCGIQKDEESLKLVRGQYATAINIHNPNEAPVEFFKKLALTDPPGGQRPGEILEIGTDKLRPDQALETDCIDIQRRLFPNGFPSPFVKGFVVLQSKAPLDVTAVYTAANLSAREVISIDVEQVRERLKAGGGPPTPGPLPDLVVKDIDLNSLVETCPGGPGTCVTKVRFTVANIGAANAGPFDSRVVFDPGKVDSVPEAVGLGAGMSKAFSATSPAGGSCFDPDCTVCVTVDSGNVVVESDETNNQLCKTKIG